MSTPEMEKHSRKDNLHPYTALDLEQATLDNGIENLLNCTRGNSRFPPIDDHQLLFSHLIQTTLDHPSKHQLPHGSRDPHNWVAA